jgi:ubiquinone/menaquinone biosynthesis C-methylase UbiE
VISYDAGAASYDQLTGRWSRQYIPTLLAQAGVQVGHRVLDVATGTGEAAMSAASCVGASGIVVGIDVSRPMLAVAAAKIAERPIVLLEMDAQTLAFKDESFDAVVCQLGLMFMPDAASALQEWTRVLRAGGRLAACVYASPDRVPLYGILMDELSRRLPDQRDVLYQPSALADAEILKRLLAAAGLKAVRVIEETRVHRFASFGDYWDPFEAGGGRHGQLYMRLSAPVRREVQTAVRDRMGPHFVDGCLEIAADVFFGVGER